MRFALTVMRYPSGRYGFVGEVPVALAFEALDGGPPDPAQVRIAYYCGPGFAKQIRKRSWPSQDEAVRTAIRLGYQVSV
jgi:hypothetical protein